MITEKNVTPPYRYTHAAWRVAHHPEAICEALRMGEQVRDLLTRTVHILRNTCHEVNPQTILDQLTREIDRLDLILRRLHAAGAVSS